MLEKDQIFLFESSNRPKYFIRHRNYLGVVSTIGARLDKENAMFKVVKGLADKHAVYVSLESVNHPGYFLRHLNSKIRLDSSKDPKFNPEDATFKALTRLQGVACAVAFESYNHPGYFIRQRNSRLYLEKEKRDSLFRNQATWSIAKKFLNFAGDERYVKWSWELVKLYLTSDSLANDKPQDDFHKINTFHESCAPDAAFNMFKWYGIDKLAGTYNLRMPIYDPKTGRRLPPQVAGKVTKVKRITQESLGRKMKTNAWLKIGKYNAPGTTTPNFIKVIKKIFQKYMSPEYQFHYHHNGSMDGYYHQFELILREGNPIAVNYKTGQTKGHFAVILGIEKKGDNPAYINDDILILANGRNSHGRKAYYMSWGEFRKAWKRDYMIVSTKGVLSLVGEYPYTNVYIKQKGRKSTKAPHRGRKPGRPGKRIK